MKSDLQGELIIANSRRERPATPPSPELIALLESDSMRLRMKAVESLAALLSNGIRHVPAPQDALAQLRDDPGSSALVTQAAAVTLGGIAPPPRQTNEAPTRVHEVQQTLPPQNPLPQPPTPREDPLVHDDAVLAVAFGPNAS